MIGLPGKHCGVLTDASGFVLETPRDPRTIDFGSADPLERGGYWKEADIGTNAIGTRHRGVATG